MLHFYSDYLIRLNMNGETIKLEILDVTGSKECKFWVA